jgi:hypothetical protein
MKSSLSEPKLLALWSEDGQDIAEYAVIGGCNSDCRSRNTPADWLQFEHGIFPGRQFNRLRRGFAFQLLSKIFDIANGRHKVASKIRR